MFLLRWDVTVFCCVACCLFLFVVRLWPITGYFTPLAST